MTCITKTSLLAFLLAAWGASATLEPEPDLSTTMGEEPAPAPAAISATTSNTPIPETSEGSSSMSSMSSISSISSTTSAASAAVSSSLSSTSASAQVATHTISLSVDLNDASSLTTTDALLSQLQAGLESASTAGATVSVAINSMQVVSEYGNLPTIIVDNIVDAVAAMSGVNRNQITVNGQKHSSLLRRLLETATCITTVNSSDSPDIVEELKRIHSSQTADNFTSQIRIANATAYGDVNASMTPAVIKVHVVTNVEGGIAPTAQNVEQQVAAATGGTVMVSDISSSGVASSSPETGGVDDTDHAAIVPMMTIWAVAYAFAMS